MEFAASVWNPQSKELISRLEQIQRRATKIPHTLKNKQYEERLAAFNISKLNESRKRGDLIEFFKLYHEMEKVN